MARPQRIAPKRRGNALAELTATDRWRVLSWMGPDPRYVGPYGKPNSGGTSRFQSQGAFDSFVEENREEVSEARRVYRETHNAEMARLRAKHGAP